jgi:hypothetical protein
LNLSDLPPRNLFFHLLQQRYRSEEHRREDRHSEWNHDERRARQDDHRDAGEQQGKTDDDGDEALRLLESRL